MNTLRCALMMMAMAGGLGALADDIPADPAPFTEYVAAQLRTELGAGVPIVVKGPLTLGFGGLQANLDRIYSYCKTGAAACPNEIVRYVKAISQVYRNSNAPPTPEAVRLVVRTDQSLQSLLAASAPQIAVQFRPFVGGLDVVPVLDSPLSVRMLTVGDNEALKLTLDQVYDLGLANLRGQAKPLMGVAKPAGKSQIGQLVGDSYFPSRLLLHDDWAPLAAAQKGKLIVVAPAKDAVFYIGEDTPKAIDALRALARDVLRRAPGPLSDTLLRWSPSGWEVVE